MIWKKARIEVLGGNKRDEIGNLIKEVVKTYDILARATEWTAEDVALYGREITQTKRKLITPSALPGELDRARIEIGSLYYNIDTVKRYKGRGLTVLFIGRVNNGKI